jgi:DNA repair exonuclease SbcCD ATPase subunit
MNEFVSWFKEGAFGREVELNCEELLNYNKVANEIATLIKDLKKSTSLDLGLDYLMGDNGEFTICIIAYDYHLRFEKSIREKIDSLESRVRMLKEERDKLTRIESNENPLSRLNFRLIRSNHSIFTRIKDIKDRILKIEKEEEKLNAEIEKENQEMDKYIRNKASINAVTDEIKKLCKSNNIQATNPLNVSSGNSLLYILVNKLLTPLPKLLR